MKSKHTRPTLATIGIKCLFILCSNRKDIQNEYRKNFKSAFQSDKEKYGFEHQASNKIDNKVIANGYSYDPAWYKEVLELRKKAGEYRVSQRKLWRCFKDKSGQSFY